MKIDGRTPSANPSPKYDVLIVGGGPAGITLAREMIPSGLTIALLEGGGEDFDADSQSLFVGDVTGLKEVDLSAIRLRMLGGASNHWGGFCLPLDPIDFSRPPLGGLSGWPFPREALADGYSRAHRYLKLGEFAYDLDVMNAGPDPLLGADETIETSVLRLSANPPTNFAVSYLPSLESSENVHVWLWTNVVDIEVAVDGRATGVKTRTLSGVEHVFTARVIVLACGAVENARQLLLMNTNHGSLYGNAGGMLGRCYMDHLSGGAAFIWAKSPFSEKAEWASDTTASDGTPVRLVWRLKEELLELENLCNAHFYLVPFPTDSIDRERLRDSARGMAGLRSIVKWAAGRGERDFVLSDSYCRFITNADAMIDAAIAPQGTIDRLLLRYESEQRPDVRNAVTLLQATDRLGMPLPSLNWSPTNEDRQSLIRTVELIGAAVGAADIGRIEIERGSEERYWNMTTAWHQMGTTRMSINPRDGVVDPTCRVHGTKNLYVAGGSVMPTGGRANPTLTIAALAIRLADHLRSEMGATS